MDNFSEIIKNFIVQMDSLKSYFDSYNFNTFKVNDALGSNEVEESIQEGMIQLLGFISEVKDDPTKFGEKLKELNRKSKLFPEEIENNPNEIIKFLATKYSNNLMKYKYENDELTVNFLDYKTSVEFRKGLKKLEKISNQQVFFHNTALLGLTNTFEYYIAQILKDGIKRNFEKSGKDKQMSLDTMLKFTTFNDAKDFLINESINQQLRESKRDVIRKICDYVTKELYKEEYSKEAEVMNEIFQRRNIVVHNKAIVNDEYLTSVPPELRKGIIKDQEIRVTKIYLHTALKDLTTFYLSLYYRYWIHITKNEDPESTRFHTYNGLAFDKLSEGNFVIAEKIYDIMRTDIKSLNGDLKLLLEINYSQTLKWQSKNVEFKRHFQRIDFSLAHDPHHLCRFLLIDDFNNACLVLGKILDDKTNHPENPLYNDVNYYIEWPIFSKFVDSEEFKDFMTQRGFDRVEVGNMS